MLKRLLVFLASLTFFVLLTEGILSLAWEKSWFDLTRERSFLDELDDVPTGSEADRFQAAAALPGPYRIHDDPRVAYVLKSETEVEIRNQMVKTDDLGMRVRPGPPPPEDAFRIVVLGDSVAFGWGLRDERVFSVQLERVLRRARGGAPPPIVCLTVAIPSWNYMNAVHFLTDHLDRLDPDLVLYMHVPNDLNSSSKILETGHRRDGLDPFSPDPLVHIQRNYAYLRRQADRLEKIGIELDPRDIGPSVLTAGLSPTSRDRLDDMARTLIALEEKLAAIGAPLVLLPYEQHELHRQLRAALIAQGHELPVIPLLQKTKNTDTQKTDPHPNGETVRTFAIWTAEALLELGLVPPAGDGEMPTIDPAYEGRRAAEMSPDEIVAWSEEMQRETVAELKRRIEHETCHGMQQVYGGIYHSGAMGPGLSALLPAGNQVRVELAPLEGREDFYPLTMDVLVNGQSVGGLPLEGNEESAVGTFPLPEEARTAPFEVTLRAPDWCIYPVLKVPRMVSANFVSLESLAE